MLASAVIIVDDGPDLRIVTQSDHAHFAAELLSLWRAQGLPEHPRRADLLLAVREHDNGWREADAAPRVDPSTGRPFDFRTYPEQDRLEIWRRGIARYAQSRPYVALLIAEHADALHRPASARWRELLAELRPEREVWRRLTGLDRRALEGDYRLLQLADRLSLTVCGRCTEAVEGGDLRGRLDADTLRLEPFPLAAATSFEIACRWIPGRRYRSDREAGAALAAARWRTIRLRVAAP